MYRFLHKELHTVLTEHNYEYEILFIDDGSVDSSDWKVESLKLNWVTINLFCFHPRKRFGKGAALQTGLDAGKG